MRSSRLSAQAGILVLFGRILSAQTNDPIFRSWRWEEEAAFAPRAAGLAGAIVGLCDEASTVVSNPAGMTTLQPPGEFHLSFAKRPSQTADGQAGIAVRVTNKLAFGFYGARVWSFSAGPPSGAPSPPGAPRGSTPGIQFSADMTDYVLAGAWRPWLKWSFGVAGRVSHSKADGKRYLDDLSMRYHFHGSSTAHPLTISAIHIRDEHIRVGIAYRRRARWGMLRDDLIKNALEEIPTGAYTNGPYGQGEGFNLVRPTLLSAGASWTTYKQFLWIFRDPLLSVQFDQVWYSQISDALVVDARRGPPFSASDYFLDDAREPRVGAEVGVGLPRPFKVRIRAGVHQQKHGQLQYGGTDSSELSLFPKADSKPRNKLSLGISLSGRIKRYMPVPLSLDFAMIRDGGNRTFVGGLAVRYPTAY